MFPIKKVAHLFLVVLIALLFPIASFGDEFTSTSFKVLDPVISSAGFSTSTNFQLLGTLAQIGTGTSTVSGFNVSAGFLYFPFVTTPVVAATGGNGQVALSWTSAGGFLGWNVSGYDIGRATVSGGPYAYTSVGNTTSRTVTGLTNNTKYYFVIRPEDTFGNAIATSSAVSVIPTAAEVVAEATLASSSGGTFTHTNSDNTSATLTVPAQFYTENLELHSFSSPNSDFASSKPPPSGKNFAGKVYDFQFFTASATQITTLSSAVTITMNYTAADVSGISENTLRPYRRESSDSAWSLIPGATLDAANHRITFSSASFNSFALIGDPVVPPPPPAPSPPAPSSSGGGGGGGGGSYYVAPATSVMFSGKAYPKSTVTLLKDAQVAASTVAGSDTNFEMSVSGLVGGNYIFSVYSEDSKGNRSSLLTFPIGATSGATTKVNGIFVAPTIAVDKSEVKRGENIAIFGQSIPKADIVISVNSDSETFVKTVADKDGVYLYNFDTSPLEIAQHVTKSKAALDGQISSFGKTVSFTVGTKTISASAGKKCPLKADLNGDCRVNLVDFSIAAYWYKRPISDAFRIQEKEKLSGDGKVDLIDFSIMAFYWTG